MVPLPLARGRIGRDSITPDWSLEDTEVPTGKKFAVNARILDDVGIIGRRVVETIDGRNFW